MSSSKGPTERAAEATLLELRRSGQPVSALVSSALRTQAGAVDLARVGGDPRVMSSASRVLTEMIKVLVLAGAKPGASDPFDDWMREVLGDDRAPVTRKR